MSIFPTMITANIASMFVFMIPATIPAEKPVMNRAKIPRMMHTITLKITLWSCNTTRNETYHDIDSDTCKNTPQYATFLKT